MRSLHLTEPSFLLRAAAIDSAGHDLFAEAMNKAQHQAAAKVHNQALAAGDASATPGRVHAEHRNRRAAGS